MYSITKGFEKGLIGILTGIGMWLTFVGLSDVTLWDLAVHYVKPVVGSTTAGGLILFAINYLKHR